MTPPQDKSDEKSLFVRLQSGVLTSIPALSALIFVVVAINSTADVVALLKGVILTLLPGFIAAVTAASLWWWAGVLPGAAGAEPAPAPGEREDPQGAARRALLS